MVVKLIKKGKPEAVEIAYEGPKKEKGRYDYEYSEDSESSEEKKAVPIARNIFPDSDKADANKITSVHAAIDTLRKLPAFNSYID